MPAHAVSFLFAYGIFYALCILNEEVSFGLVHCSTVFALLSEGILFNLTYRYSGDSWFLPFGLGGECYSPLPSANFESAFEAYIELSRNTPLLIQLFFLYFGLPRIGLVLSSEACAVVGLIFLGGSYMAESFRSGLEAVSQTQHEVGLSIGLTPFQVFRYVVLPQAVAVALPSFSANVIFLIKETSVFSAVALADLMYVAKDLIGLYYETDVALGMLVVAYLLMLLPISLVFSWIERRLRYAGFGLSGSSSGE